MNLILEAECAICGFGGETPFKVPVMYKNNIVVYIYLCEKHISKFKNNEDIL